MYGVDGYALYAKSRVNFLFFFFFLITTIRDHVAIMPCPATWGEEQVRVQSEMVKRKQRDETLWLSDCQESCTLL